MGGHGTSCLACACVRLSLAAGAAEPELDVRGRFAAVATSEVLAGRAGDQAAGLVPDRRQGANRRRAAVVLIQAVAAQVGAASAVLAADAGTLVLSAGADLAALAALGAGGAVLQRTAGREAVVTALHAAATGAVAAGHGR